MEEELLTVDELCDWLKITRKTSERWRKDGMPFIKVGRTVRFDKAEILEWLKNHNKNN